MDFIRLKNMRFFAYHGVMDEEAGKGQRFEVDVELGCDLRRAGESDEVAHTCDYSVIYEIVSGVLFGHRLYLIETMAKEIANKILERFPMVAVKVTVRKPDAPLPGDFDYAEVEISRGPLIMARL